MAASSGENNVKLQDNVQISVVEVLEKRRLTLQSPVLGELLKLMG